MECETAVQRLGTVVFTADVKSVSEKCCLQTYCLGSFLAVLGHVKMKPENTKMKLNIVWTVYHLVVYMQSNKIHNVVLMSKFIQHLC